MAADCRFSMADSEWSRDDFDENVEHYSMDPVRGHNFSKSPMYDLPPDVAARVMLHSADNVSDQPRPTLQQQNVKEKESKEIQFKPTKEQPVKCWVKAHIAILTVIVLILFGTIIFIIVKSQFTNTDADNEKSNGLSPSGRIRNNNSISKLKEKVDNMQNILREILQLVKSQDVQENAEALTSENGCLNKDIKINTTCYSINYVAKLITQEQAKINCYAINQDFTGELAMVKTEEIQNKLLEAQKTQSGFIGSIWVGGSRSNNDHPFKFNDGSEININGRGFCLALNVKQGSISWQPRGCNKLLNMYLCQYPASN